MESLSNDTIICNYKLLSENARRPTKAYYGDACFDLYAAENYVIKPYNCKTVFFDIALEIPDGYRGVIYGRSGMQKNGIICAVGIVDSGYRGNIGATLLNYTGMMYNIEVGNRVAQLAIEKVYNVQLFEVDELKNSKRGENGYGSTGS